MKKTQAFRLPPAFKKYFWDVNFKRLSFTRHQVFILGRIMRFGDLFALRWLLRYVPKRIILKVLRENRELDAKTRNFWQVTYGSNK